MGDHLPDCMGRSLTVYQKSVGSTPTISLFQLVLQHFLTRLDYIKILNVYLIPTFSGGGTTGEGGNYRVKKLISLFKIFVIISF